MEEKRWEGEKVKEEKKWRRRKSGGEERVGEMVK